MSLITYLTTIRFDFGASQGLADDVAELGIKAPLIIADKGIEGAGLVNRLKAVLPRGQDVPVFTETPTNPTERAVLAALDLYRSEGCDGLIAIGGARRLIWRRASLFCRRIVGHWSNTLRSWAVFQGSLRRLPR